MTNRRGAQLDREIAEALHRRSLAPGRWYYDYDEGHFHHVARVTPKVVEYDVVDDGIVIVRRSKPRAVADRAIAKGTWIPVNHR